MHCSKYSQHRSFRSDISKRSAACEIITFMVSAMHYHYWSKQRCLGAVPEIILGGGPQAIFCPVVGGCFVDNVSDGLGGGVTCPGGQGVFDP